MDIESLIYMLDHPDRTPEWLGGWGLQDLAAGRARLAALVEHGLTLDLLATLCGQLSDELPGTPEPDEVLAALVDFIGASRSPLALAALFQRDRHALPMLLNVLKLGARWRKILVDDPEAFDLLRMTDGQPVAANWLRSEVCTELAHFSDERHILAGLRRIKQRELLRIVYGDVYKRHRFELVTEQLTILADALLEAAIQAAQRKLLERVEPRRSGGWTGGRVSIIALGRLGGFETDYSDRLELLLVHEPLPEDEHARRAGREYFDRFGRLLLRYLTEAFEGQAVYSVELPIRLEGQTSPIAGADEVFNYLDTLGRTWHREAAVKTRAAAGDSELARQMLRQLQPWIYRRYLNRADETGIRALKRRLQRRISNAPAPGSNPSSITAVTKQIEEVVQFLQLLGGGDNPIVRATNTLSAIAGLEQAGVLSVQERTALEDDYRTLRIAEHHAQLGLVADDERIAEAARRSSEITTQLLTSAFPNEAPATPEADLLLDPQPTDDEIRAVLERYGFRNVRAAYEYLQRLANEHVQFLSTRRCRYFLSAIAPQLLSAVAGTPDPDATLANLSVVSDSVGGKGVLWELFSFNPPSLQLYVRLCAASPYLSGILTSHPGMVDELVDSLQLARLPTRDELNDSLQELTRGARDPLALLHGFKNSNHLQIGVRELLGRDTIDVTQRTLADVAETCLGEIIRSEYEKLAEKFGTPTIGESPDASRPCRFAVLATGELGGHELGYQSDVELLFVYEGEGMTQLVNRGRREAKTTNGHFFSQLAQRVTKTASQLTPWGRLYTVEIPLRSSSGGLAFSVAGLQEQLATADVSLAQWQSLSRARPIFDDEAFAAEADAAVRSLAIATTEKVAGRATDRVQLGGAAPSATTNLRDLPGGSREIEAFVSLLQIQHVSQSPAILKPGTLDALAALRDANLLPGDAAEALQASYRWLRHLESALRLASSDQRLALPTDPVALGKVALLLRQTEPETLARRAQATLEENCKWFRKVLPQNTAAPAEPEQAIS